MNLIQRARNLIQRTGNGAGDSSRTGYRVLMTSGSSVLGAPAWSSVRSADSRMLQQLISGYSGLDDSTIARAVNASAIANRCIEYRASTTSSMVLYAVDSTRERVDNSPFYWLIDHSAELLWNATYSLMAWGRCYLRKHKNAHGYATGLEWINPLLVIPNESSGVVVSYSVRDAGWRWNTLAPDELIDIRMFDPDPDGDGLSKVELAYRHIGLAQSILLQSAAFFTNGMQLSGFLFLPENLTDEQFDQAGADFQRNFSGAANAHKVSVTRSGQATWVPSQPPPKDLAMRELSERNDDMIGAVFDVDLALLGLKAQADPLGAGSTYSAKEVTHLRSVTLPFLRRIILAGINDQWASVDFRDPRGGSYRIEVDESAHPALAEAALTLTSTAGAVTSANLADYDEGRTLLRLPAREGGYFSRPTGETLSVYQQGVGGLNEARSLIGLPPLSVIPDGDDVMLIGGQPILVSRLMEVGNASVDKLIAPPTPSPFGLSSGTGAPPVADEPEVREDDKTDTSFWIGIPFTDHPDLIAAQNAVRELCVGMSVNWASTDSFHTTLIYVPRATDEQVTAVLAAIRAIPAPDFALRVGSFNQFNTPQGYNLHFRVKESGALRAYQRQLYDVCEAAGMELSSYSKPDQYIPHISMGYSAEKPPRKTWASRYTLPCDAIECCHGDHNVVYETGGAEPVIDQVVVSPEPVLRAARGSIALVVPFTENALIRAARRELSSYLTECGETRTEWFDESWSLTLAVTNGAKADAARLVRSCDYADTRKADAMTAGYNWINGTRMIGLTVEPSAALVALRQSAAMDVDGDAVTPLTIPLVTLPDDCDVDLSGAPEARYPLVASSVILAFDGVTQHEWTLKGASSETRDELSAWRRVADKSLDRARSFAPLALRAHPRVALFVRMALELDDADTADVFDHAAAMLRAYRDTRAAFTARIEELLGQAVRAEITRQAFGSRMRSTLTRFGVQTINDAFEEVKVELDGIDQETLTLFRVWEKQQYEYIRDLSTEIYKEEGGLTEAGVSTRAGLWGSKSLDDLYYEMIRHAAPNMLMTWRRDPAKESCEDCLERENLSLTLDEWGKLGFPRNSKLRCGGWQCGCSLVDENGKVYRAFRDEPEPDYSAYPKEHSHDHSDCAL